MTEKPSAPSARRDTVPAEIDSAVLTALQKLPADRFATAVEFAAALDAVPPPPGPARTAGLDRVSWEHVRISEATCRRLTRAAFDPRLVGSELSYLDNGLTSDVLVCHIAACGRGGDQFLNVLRESRYRAVAPTFLGFEPRMGWRPAFSIEDHLVLVREFLRELAARLRPRVTIISGFSSGGDFALRLAAAPDPDARVRLDGCLTLGANLSIGTCFMTRALATLPDHDEPAMLAILQNAGQAAGSLDEWVNICEYGTAIVPAFRYDAAPLRLFAAGISDPFEGEPLAAFAAWYCAAGARGCRLRCVFEDTGLYRKLLRDLQLRNFDDGILGDRHEDQSVIAEAGTNHFDLLRPAMVAKHLDALVARIG